MPHGVGNAYAFQVFNTISFSIVLMTPMLLYFKRLGASATVLGIVTALPALLNILQIPAAQFVEQIGYRAFVLRGWSLRAVFILGMAAVAALPDTVDAATKMALMLALLFAFNISRGISVCGFLPWITQWIPEEVRGRYLSRDQMCQALATVGTMLAAAAYLERVRARVGFAVVFAASFVSAVISLVFLRRIPDVPPPHTGDGRGRVPWKEMALYPPFRRLLVYNAVLMTALAGGGVFWVPCLRDEFHLSNAQVLVFGSVTPMVVAACLWWLGRLVDRTGSRPVLAMANAAFALHFGGWAMLSARLLPLGVWSVLGIQVFSGLAWASFNLANARLAMAIVPAMGRSHFFALFSVVGGLVLGVLPVFWGIAMDAMAGWRATTGPWEWNPFSVLYMALVGVVAAAQICQARLTEPRAMTTEEFFRELFVMSPARAITRLIARRPFS